MTYNLPAVRWLAKKDPEAALAVLQRIRDETCNYGAEAVPAYLDPRDRSADDAETHDVPDKLLTSETMTESVSDGPDEVFPEMLHEEQPSERDIGRALGWIEWPFTGRSAPIGWCMPCPCCGRIGLPEPKMNPVAVTGNVIEVGSLTYYALPEARRGKPGGMLLRWVDRGGKIRHPSHKASKPRGGKRPYRLDPWGYLAVKPTTPAPMDSQPLQPAFSGEPVLMPMYTPLLRKAPDAYDHRGRYGVEEAHADLRAMGIDGSVPFERLPFPATKCPTGIAKDARFIGGISGRSQTASSSVIGKVEESPKVEARVEGILDEVASRGTLESIGVRLGYRGGYADRAGGKALLEAGKAILAANDNNRQKIAA